MQIGKRCFNKRKIIRIRERRDHQNKIRKRSSRQSIKIRENEDSQNMRRKSYKRREG